MQRGGREGGQGDKIVRTQGRRDGYGHVTCRTAHPQNNANITSAEKPSLTSLPPPKPARFLPLGNSAPCIYLREHSVLHCALNMVSLYLHVGLLQETESCQGMASPCIYCVQAEHRAGCR